MATDAAEKNRFLLNFLLFDQDSDGKVKIEDLGPLLRSIGLHITNTEVQGIAPLVDPNGLGYVTREDFLHIAETLAPRKIKEEEIKEAFRVLDEDGDGFMTTDQLRHVLVNLGNRMTSEEADEILGDVEVDPEKHINIDDFIEMLMKE